ncbi:hypothetical protein AgCh_010568 [Apium graveolens]
MSCIVTSGGNVAAKLSVRKVEGDDGLKTIECLRGRLLSERVASKAANQEADNLGYKLIELQIKLKEEVEWRSRAQKRLKSLVKKLGSMKIVNAVSDESSSHSTSIEKSELGTALSVSSSSSTVSSFSYPCRQPEENDKKNPDSQMRILNLTIKNFQSCRPKSPVKDRETCRENHQDRDETIVDNSMALVPVDIPATTQIAITNIEPLAANNARVEDVLNTLRTVKERLQSSMESRRVIRVGL